MYHLHPKQLINVIFQTLQSHYSILKEVKHNFELFLGQEIHCPLGHCFSAENFPSSSPFRRAAFSDTRYTSVATFFYFNGSYRRRRGAAWICNRCFSWLDRCCCLLLRSSLRALARVKKLGPFRLTSALLNSGVNSLSSSQLLLLLLLEKLSKSPYRRLFSFKMRKLDRLRPKGWLAFLAQHFLILTNDHMTAKLQKLCKSNACTKGWFAMVIKHPF